MKVCQVLSLFVVLFGLVHAQNIVYPEDEERESQQNANDRRPLYAPDRCGMNELLYPGDQENDWACDCGPAFVYYPTKDACFAAYRQGPCQNGEYLVLKKKKIIPECVKNPCRQDKKVAFKGRCYDLNGSNGCPPVELGGGVLRVNATTLEIQCQPAETSSLNLIQVPAKCPPGSKRSTSGQCRREFNGSK